MSRCSMLLGYGKGWYLSSFRSNVVVLSNVLTNRVQFHHSTWRAVIGCSGCCTWRWCFAPSHGPNIAWSQGGPWEIWQGQTNLPHVCMLPRWIWSQVASCHASRNWGVYERVYHWGMLVGVYLFVHVNRFTMGPASFDLFSFFASSPRKGSWERVVASYLLWGVILPLECWHHII